MLQGQCKGVKKWPLQTGYFKAQTDWYHHNRNSAFRSGTVGGQAQKHVLFVY